MGKRKVKNRRQWKKEQKNRKKWEELAEITGLYFENEIETKHPGFPFGKYIMNALALFGSTYGTIACLITSFHLQVNTFVLFTVCAVLAMVFSFMYSSKKVKMTVYLVLLVLTYTLMISFYPIINSGVSALHNECIQAINNVISLSNVREYTEFISDRYLTMTAALCTVAVGMSMILNIFISEYMNVVAVFLITFPVVQFGIYFGMEPDLFPLGLVIVSWLIVAVTGNSGGYNGLERNLTGQGTIKKKKHYYAFRTDSLNMAAVSFCSLLFVSCFGILFMLFVPKNNFVLSTPFDKVKEETFDSADQFLSYGAASLFIRTQNVESGKLSNRRSVHFDGREDLSVQMTDDINRRIYLKNYTADRYDSETLKWYQSMERLKEFQEKELSERNQAGEILKWDYEHGRAVCNAKRQMKITVTDLALQVTGNFFPYYTPSARQGVSQNNEASYQVEYYAQDTSVDEKGIMDIYYMDGKKIKGADNYLDNADVYYKLARKYDLEVPEQNQKVIAQICKKENLRPDSDTVVEDVVNYLTQNYSYTLKPGKLPKSKDYVNYFLTENKKGYCEHFASSAVLMLRYLGVPARYASGYVIDPENVEDAKEVKGTNINEWNSEATDGQVCEISVPDSNAHAWVEIYEYGLGWVPLEVTLADSIDDENGGGFFSDIFNNVNTSVSDTVNSMKERFDNAQAETTKKRLVLFIVFLTVTALVLFISRTAYHTYVRIRGFHTDDYGVNLSNYYSYLIQIYKMLPKHEQRNLSYEQFSAMLCDSGILSETQAEQLLNVMEQAIFSRQGVEEETYQQTVCLIRYIVKQMWKEISFAKRIQFYLK